MKIIKHKRKINAIFFSRSILTLCLANAGNIGINIGVAAPMAQFPFSGWGDSFFGDLHGQGRHAIEFFTQTKIVIEKWPKEWSRKF